MLKRNNCNGFCCWPQNQSLNINLNELINLKIKKKTAFQILYKYLCHIK